MFSELNSLLGLLTKLDFRHCLESLVSAPILQVDFRQCNAVSLTESS